MIVIKSINRIISFNNISNIQYSILAFYRIFITSVALIDIFSLKSDFAKLFSFKESVLPQVIMYLNSDYYNFLQPIYNYINSINLLSDFYKSIVIIYVISLTFLTLGFFTRISAFFSLILQLLIFKSFDAFNYGFDFFLTMSLFYLIIFPSGRKFSLDNYIFRKKKRAFVNFNYLRVLQIHLCIVYFFAGLAKAVDIDWYNGYSLMKAIVSVDNTYYNLPHFVFVGLGIGTVFLELLYPFIVWTKFKKWGLYSIIAMHLGIAFMMKLYSFAAIMIVWNIVAFGQFNFDNRTNIIKPLEV